MFTPVAIQNRFSPANVANVDINISMPAAKANNHQLTAGKPWYRH